MWGMILATVVGGIGFAQDKAPPAPTTASPDKSAVPVSNPATPAESAPPEAKPLPTKAQLSAWSLEIQKLAQAQVEEQVMLAYVTNSAGVFNLGADDIICLKDQGVSPAVINAMMRHDQKLLSGARPLAANAAAPPAPAAQYPSPVASQNVANEEAWDTELLLTGDGYYAPEQPDNTGPVRAPYPVKLNDPILILHLPSLAVPHR